MKITTQFDGFEVVANVYGSGSSPYGLRDSLEVYDMEGEITDAKEFEAVHGLAANDDSLALVMKAQEGAIIERIVEDACDVASERGDY